MVRAAVIAVVAVAVLLVVTGWSVLAAFHGKADAEVVSSSTTTTTTALPPSSTTTTMTTPSPRRLSLSSTRYCEHGVMANGRYVHDGAVSSKVLRRGSRWRVLTGPLAGRVFTVEDTGSLAIFDTWVDSCAAAIAYGRQTIQVEAV